MKKKIILFVLLFSFLSCEQPGPSVEPPIALPFTLELENSTDQIVNLKVHMEIYAPEEWAEDLDTGSEAPPFTQVLNENASVILNMEGLDTVHYNIDVNRVLRDYIKEVTFLNDQGEILRSFQSYDDQGNQILLIPEGQPNAGRHQWEFPSNDRPFYLEIDEDGETGRIVITGNP